MRVITNIYSTYADSARPDLFTMNTTSELTCVEKEIEECDKQISVLKTNTDAIEGSIDEFINDEETCVLEIRRESLEARRKELIELRSYQDSCEHLFVKDLVDLNPDQSLTIEYCERCMFCK